MTGRQRAYFLVRGAAVVAFVLSWSVMPPGNGAAAVAIGAGVVGVLTCLGVNAGGPGERAGARLEQQRWLAVRAPQGDWPPYDEDRVVDGEVVSEGPLSPPDRPAG